jgi:hypothetical protein
MDRFMGRIINDLEQPGPNLVPECCKWSIHQQFTGSKLVPGYLDFFTALDFLMNCSNSPGSGL